MQPIPLGRCVRLVALLLPLLAFAHAAEAAKRVALVVGNGAYKEVQPLANPGNDARGVAEALKRLGFEVELGLDLDRNGLWRAVQRLDKRGKEAEAALFFYAGHGVQKDQSSYLVPVDAGIETESDLPAFTVRLADILQLLADPRRATLVFLDACRNDPFKGKPATSRALLPGSGVGQPSAAGGMLIAYATGEGDTAADGKERNSPFTAALLQHLEEPGLEVKGMLTRVRKDLSQAGARQLTETSDRLIGDFYFKPAVAVAEVPPPSTPAPSLADRPDYVLWNGLSTNPDEGELQLFLRLYPTSPLAPLAEARLLKLRSTGTEAAAKPKPAPAPPAPVAAPAKPAAQPSPGPTIAAVEEKRALTPPETLHVQGEGASLRGRPVNGGPRIAFLNPGTAVSVLRRQAGWAEVAVNEQRGFVPLRTLGKTPPPPAPPPIPARAVGEVFRDCAGCPELVAVAPGSFTLGSPQAEAGREDNEGPQRPITLKRPLAVGRVEVTFAEWDACVAAKGCEYRPDDKGWGRERRPVTSVSHADAVAYLDWLSRTAKQRYRLPSEAEWEFLARAGDRGTNPWAARDAGACRFGNVHDQTSLEENRFVWEAASCADGYATTAPVGSYAANGFGLHDMLGNLEEWTADCWSDDLTGLPEDAAAGTQGDCGRRALRGGSWRSNLENLRYAARTPAEVTDRTSTNGFRVVRDLGEGLTASGAPVAKATQ